MDVYHDDDRCVQRHDEESAIDDGTPQIDDRDDFASVFRDLYEPLVRYARGVTAATASAEDVVQAVFTTLWEDRETIVVQRSLKALLYTMVRNRALNANRNENNKAATTRPQDIDAQETVTVGADEQLAAKNLRRRLSEWIDDLPPRRREAFVLSRYHGLSHEEIARVMDVSKRTADTHVMHALQDLRRHLDELRNEDDLP